MLPWRHFFEKGPAQITRPFMAFLSPSSRPLLPFCFCVGEGPTLKLLSSGWKVIHTVINKTNAPGNANNRVRFHLLNAPAIACEMGNSPVLDNIIKDIIRPSISLGALLWIGCKSAKMSVMGYLWRVLVLADFYSTTKSPFTSAYFWRRYCFLHPFFIHPHRKDISHEHNPDAPRERNPDVITNRLT